MDFALSAPEEVTAMRALFTGSLNWKIPREHGAYGGRSATHTNCLIDQPSLYSGGKHAYAFYTKFVKPVKQRSVIPFKAVKR